MQKVWAAFKSHPYLSNITGYTALFASADLIQQSMLGGRQGSQAVAELRGYDDDTPAESRAGPPKAPLGGIDWAQTARVALVGFCFHANFNYHWLRALERVWPGGGVKRVTLKVVVDQLVAAPATISAFYIGLSALEGKEDPFEDWRNKFWTSYKAGVVYWSTLQAVNFSLVPPVARTVFVGGVALTWTVFLCHFRQLKSDPEPSSTS
ncbi:mpv17-like protein [Engraulis encrasicolus]|uniref:mpv17-like protein n=1 Tax=Engraulis encrasicolus TaxID=184585 RepID=UPI002FD4D582